MLLHLNALLLFYIDLESGTTKELELSQCLHDYEYQLDSNQPVKCSIIVLHGINEVNIEVCNSSSDALTCVCPDHQLPLPFSLD